MKVRIVVVSALVILAVCWVLAAQDYMVILRNGKFLRAREPMKVVGKNVHITLISGTLVSYPVDQIDFVQSERYNKLGLGGAWIIDELTQDVVMPPTRTPTPRLSDFGILMDEQFAPSDLPPTPTPTPAILLRDVPYADSKVETAFREYFDRNRLYLFRISVGTQPQFIFVQAVTDTDKEVFTAITLAAEALMLIEKLHPELAPEAVELEMLTTAEKPAGIFRITRDAARKLTSKQISVEQFYVENVIF